jgi:hypothetical protein
MTQQDYHSHDLSHSLEYRVQSQEKYGIGTMPTQYLPLTHRSNEQALYDPILEYNSNLTMPII